jgi:hypothetical protein
MILFQEGVRCPSLQFHGVDFHFALENKTAAKLASLLAVAKPEPALFDSVSAHTNHHFSGRLSRESRRPEWQSPAATSSDSAAITSEKSNVFVLR